MISTFETNSLNAGAAFEIEVTAVVQAFHAALTDADKETLETLLDKSLSYGHSDGTVETKARFIENILNRKSVFDEIEVSDQIIIEAGDVALVRHTFNAKTNNNNIPASVSLHILLVWKKQDDQWNLLARQAVKI